jgi:hypothetical protein
LEIVSLKMAGEVHLLVESTSDLDDLAINLKKDEMLAR